MIRKLLPLAPAVLFAACAGADTLDSEDVDVTSQAIDSGVVCPQGGATPAIAVARWADPELVTFVQAGSGLPAVVENPRDEGAWVTVAIRASGLDGRQSRLELGGVWLGGHEALQFDLPIDAVPIQSVGAPSSVWLEAEVWTQDGPIDVPSTSIEVEFVQGYQGAITYGTAGKDWGVPEDPQGLFAALGNLASALTYVDGRIFDPQWGFVDVAMLRQQDPAASAVGQSVAIVGHHGDTLWGAGDTGSGFSDWAPGRVRFCTAWLGAYSDSGFGEDYLNDKGVNRVPARHTWVSISKNGSSAPVWSNVTDVEGCTPYIDVGPGDYAVAQVPKLVRANTGAIGEHSWFDVVYDAVRGAPTLVTSYKIGWTGPPSDTIDLTPSRVDQATSVAAVMTQPAAVVADAELVPGTYPIHADQRCPGPEEYEACVTDGIVYIGANHDGTHNANYKFVVAHELGHLVQEKAFGWQHYDYDDDAPSPAWCRCDHVDVHNDSHCLQSREHDGAAMTEGFAHFYASKLMNDPTGGDCRFIYYKDFLPPPPEDPMEPALGVRHPPVRVDCLAPVHWMESYCPADGHGVERDWMTFFYRITSAPPSERTTLQDLGWILRGACHPGSSTPGVCSGNSIHWSDIYASALAFHGAYSARATRFAADSVATGVDH